MNNLEKMYQLGYQASADIIIKKEQTEKDLKTLEEIQKFQKKILKLNPTLKPF